MLVPIKEAIDVLTDKFEFKVLYQFFEEMGLDTNALTAEKKRRNKERKIKQLSSELKTASFLKPDSKQGSVDGKSQQALSKETESLIKLDIQVQLSEDQNVEKMKDADKALDMKIKLEASDLVEKGLRLGRMIKQDSIILSHEIAEAQRGIQKVLKQSSKNLKKINQPLTVLNRRTTVSSEDSESQSNLQSEIRIIDRTQPSPAKFIPLAEQITQELNSKFALQLQAQQ